MATKKTSKETIRQRAERSSSAAPKRKRVRTAASSAGKPLKKAWSGATREYHAMPQKESGFLGFLTKSRSLFPRYIANAWTEVRQVTWPNRRTTWKLVLAVFLFATVFGVTIALVDYVLEKIFKQILL
ncbi:MAG: preprotein translocase subunit SecE [bacterium]|nr:preprotein translocase subunit SecE [bacterium]